MIKRVNVLTKPGTVDTKVTKIDTTLKYDPEIKVKKIKK
jgi:hypothetical protein